MDIPEKRVIKVIRYLSLMTHSIFAVFQTNAMESAWKAISE